MLALKKKAEAVATPSLANRIAELRRDIEALIESRIDEIKAPGIPRGVIRQTLLGGIQCHCNGAMKILADKIKDEEIAKRAD